MVSLLIFSQQAYPVALGGLFNSAQGTGLLGQGQQNQQGGSGGLFGNGNSQQQGSGLLGSANNQQQGANPATGGLLSSLQQPSGNNGGGATGGLFQNQAGGQANQSNQAQGTGGGGLFQNLNQGSAGGLLQQQQQGAKNTQQQQGQANATSGNNQTQSNPHLFGDAMMQQMPNFYNMQMQMMNQLMSMMQNQMKAPQPAIEQQQQQHTNSVTNSVNVPSTPLTESTSSYSLKSLGGKISETFRSQDFQHSIFSNSLKRNIKPQGGTRKPENASRLKKTETSAKLSQGTRNNSLISHKPVVYRSNRDSLQFMFKDEEENYRGSAKSSTQSNQMSSRYSKQSTLGFNETINVREIRSNNTSIYKGFLKFLRYDPKY